MNLDQIRAEARAVSEQHSGSMAGDVADYLIYFMEHWQELVPAGFTRPIRKPELFGKGIPNR